MEERLEDSWFGPKESKTYLPNHAFAVPLLLLQNSSRFIIAKSAFAYVHRTASADTTIKLMDYIFDKQDQFTEEVLLNYTLDNFLNELAALIASVTVIVLWFSEFPK